jgi:glycosyltransferase involved in cell wall biosynthesis/SAM-dependent methyltransferase
MTERRNEVGVGNEGAQPAVGGIFLVGAFASGVEYLGGALLQFGISSLSAEDGRADLAAGNQRLLEGVISPEATADELVRRLGLQALDDETGALTAAVRRDIEVRREGPWMWVDWRLSLLGQFWADATSVRPAVIFVHRRSTEVAAAHATSLGEDTMSWWFACNRSALVLCSRFPSLVVNYSDIVSGPKDVLNSILEFLEDLGMAVDADVGKATAYLEAATADEVTPANAAREIEPRYQTMDRLLDQFDVKPGRDNKSAWNPGQLTRITAGFYDETYYWDYSGGGVPYSRSEKYWVEFFSRVAESIVETLHPRRVLDAGCAIGLLVEALRERGVDARGVDISAWAIEQVPDHLRQFCRIGSITDEIDGDYDLITCVEVLEHLPPSLAEAAVANLCQHAQAVLFSSTPDEFDEPSHLNVEPSEYWSDIFLRQGFIRDFDYDASFLAPHSILFRRGEVDAAAIVRGYERKLWTTGEDLRTHLREAVAEHDHLATRYNELSLQIVDTKRLRDENALLAESLDNEQKRRLAETAAAYEMVHQFELGQRIIAGQLAARDAEIAAIHNTKIFRYSAKLRAVYGRHRGRRTPATPAPASLGPADGTYEKWIELFDTRDEAARQRIEARVRALPSPPMISVIMPVYNPPVDLLRSAIESVRSQIYPNWELCIADDCSTDTEVVKLLEECEANDSRIRVVRRSENGHISAASNSALSLATGTWAAPLDHDDLLADHALALVALSISEHPGAGLFYSDEDKMDESGVRCDPFFKPDFDPLLLAGQNYISHLTVCRKDLAERAGGYREGYEGSQDWDLVLRVSELLTTNQVVHIPHVLYHWRAHGDSTASLVSTKPYALEAGLYAVRDHLSRTDRSGSVVRQGRLGHNRVRWTLPEPVPHVSIIVPTRDGRLLQRCIDSVLDFTVYPDFEVVVIDNSSRRYQTLSWLQGHDDRLSVLRDERPFNYAALNNFAVNRTAGEIVCLLNDDTEVMSGDWLTEMVGQLIQPGVGAVGAKLLYDDGRIQHAGVILGVGGVAGHAHRLSDRVSMGYFGNLQLAHRVSAVTAACVAVRREAWEQVNGMDEVNLPVAFNDVDLCLRLGEVGWDVVWTPHAQLLHHESISRGPDTEGPRAEAFADEVLYMEKRWGFDSLRKDKYYNPNLSLNAEDFSLAWPPRVSYDQEV